MVPRRRTPVYNVEPEEIHCDDGVYQAPFRFIEEQGGVFVTQVTDDGAVRVPTEELRHIYGSQGTVSESYASDEVYAIYTNRNRWQPAWAQPTQQQRPGWVSYKNEPTDICFECFGLGHKKPNCPHLLKTYFDLQFEEKLSRSDTTTEEFPSRSWPYARFFPQKLPEAGGAVPASPFNAKRPVGSFVGGRVLLPASAEAGTHFTTTADPKHVSTRRAKVDFAEPSLEKLTWVCFSRHKTPGCPCYT